MTVRVKIPTPLRSLTGDRATVDVQAGTLAELVADLEGAFPGMRERLCEDSGELRRFVNVYVNGEDVRFLDGIGTTVTEGDEVSIVPAVAGGAAVAALWGVGTPSVPAHAAGAGRCRS